MNIHELRFRAGEILDQICYCSNLNMNGLFRIDLRTGNLSFIDYFNEPIDIQDMHWESFFYKEWIGFVPGNAKNITLYNWKTKKFHHVDFNDGKGYWVSSVICNNIAWFIPLEMSNPIFSLNLDTFSICIYQSPIECLRSKNITGELYRSVYWNGNIYAAVYETSYIFCFCVETKEMKILDIGINDLCAIDIGKDGLWILTEHEKKVYYWNPELEEKKAFQCLTESSLKNNERIGSFVLETENDVYLFPGRMDANILKLNRNTGIFKTAFLYPTNLIWRDQSKNYFWGRSSHGGKHYIYPYNANYMFTINDGKIKGIHIKSIDEIENGEVLNSYISSIIAKGIIRESKLLLGDFLSQCASTCSQKENRKEKIGNSIYFNVANT